MNADNSAPVAPTANDYRSNHKRPDPARRIHWAASPMELELDALRSRNWITEELISFSARHWHCSREQAVERLLAANPG